MHAFTFAGRPFFLRADRSLFWPERRALLVADLHLDKASWLARTGQMLPPYDSRETLRRLTAAIDDCGAREVWALGDSFHDADGPARLPEDEAATLATLARHVRLCWVEGNHDRDAAARHGDLPGEWIDECVVDGITLRHIGGGAGPEISGHFHPKLRVQARGRSLSRPCFLFGTDDRLVLPSFGALTGGLDCQHPALAHFLPAKALVATRSALHSFSL